MHSQHKKRPHFKDNGFINMRETVCIFKPNLHTLDLCSTQHPAAHKGGRGPEIYNDALRKVQSIKKPHMLIVFFPNAVNILKHLEEFYVAAEW